MLSTNLFSGLSRNAGDAAADLTRLAVQATNQRAGVAKSTSDGSTNGRGPAVTLSPSLTQATAGATDATAISGEDLGGRGNAGEGHRILAEAMGESVSTFTLILARERETLRTYQETGELYSIQPTGKYKLDPQSPEGAAHLESVLRAVETLPAIIEQKIQKAAEAQENYRLYMDHLKAHAASSGN